jgi:hypothetical protein
VEAVNAGWYSKPLLLDGSFLVAIHVRPRVGFLLERSRDALPAPASRDVTRPPARSHLRGNVPFLVDSYFEPHYRLEIYLDVRIYVEAAL